MYQNHFSMCLLLYVCIRYVIYSMQFTCVSGMLFIPCSLSFDAKHLFVKKKKIKMEGLITKKERKEYAFKSARIPIHFI